MYTSQIENKYDGTSVPWLSIHGVRVAAVTVSVNMVVVDEDDITHGGDVVLSFTHRGWLAAAMVNEGGVSVHTTYSWVTVVQHGSILVLKSYPKSMCLQLGGLHGGLLTCWHSNTVQTFLSRRRRDDDEHSTFKSSIILYGCRVHTSIQLNNSQRQLEGRESWLTALV